ncbi:hypothetical protein CN271_04270 [Bacillus cereus]|uniref:hypothetical protein n=1 Tax=Bacillus cereus group TaxID=86661 RepID=UPI00027BFD32|nr:MULTISPECIES: hypothetical protein [Bacillus cereus group]EJV89551.1 hypothetical protein IGI_05687 [Bacillus toyonensis]PET44859.1 hypothetical protein CN523_17760 [Bacillus cereus]PFD79345.1 hypothetical protein CN271_04270 [Bacillus cereus]
MISISIWLIIGIVTVVLFKKYKFQKEKLEEGKYDEYGLRLLLLSAVVIYITKQWLDDVLIAQLILIPIFIIVIPIFTAYMIKQMVYDYENGKYSFYKKK